MRRCLPHLVLAAAMSSSVPAFAQNPNCPPGSWFCTEAEAQPEAPPPEARPAPADDPDAPAPPTARRQRTHPGYGPPPVVVYEPPPSSVVIVSPGYHPVHRIPPPPPAPQMLWHPEWGINLRVEGVGFARQGAAKNAGMGGIGGSLRYRPVPHFALEAGLDMIAGNDFNGFERTEIPFTLNGLLYLNPRNRVQVYLLGGMQLSRAEVSSDRASPLLEKTHDGYGANYTYFGGQGGGGLEFRLSRRVGLDLDVLGFMRKRTDDGKAPEYVDWQHNRATNTSGGALFRGGLTFWW